MSKSPNATCPNCRMGRKSTTSESFLRTRRARPLPPVGSEKQIEFVEKIFREVFGFGDRDTIDTIVSNINSDKNRVVGQECRITVEENNYVDKQGNQKMGVRVKYINAPRSSQPAEDLAGFKARIRAVRSGAFAAKPASAQSAPKPAAPARPSNPAPASDGDFSSDAPW